MSDCKTGAQPLTAELTQAMPAPVNAVAPGNPNEVISLSVRAAQQFERVLADKPAGWGIRLGLLSGGCSGLQYDMEPAEASRPGEVVQALPSPNGDIPFFISPLAVGYLKGTELDFSDALIDGGFKFNNPNAKNACGCGTSFGV